MGARQKLNVAYIQGGLIVAASVGALAMVASLVMTGCSSSATDTSSAPAAVGVELTFMNQSRGQEAALNQLAKAYTSKTGVKVTIDFCKTDKGVLEVYMTYILEDCMISGYSISSGGDRPSESCSLNFTKIEYKNIPMSDVGAAASPETVAYDLALAKVM